MSSISKDASSTVPFDSYTPNVAIVTGAAQGIGRAVAQRLAEDGIDIVANDIPSKVEQLNKLVEELRKKGRRAIAVAGDVSSEADVIALVEKAAQQLGGVDIMVANAGVAEFSPFVETTVKDFDRISNINIRGTFLCLKHAARQMIKQGRGGRLIAASSLAGKQGLIHAVAYCASKFAIRGMVQTASLDLRKYGITANAFAPGYILTPMLTHLIEHDPEFKASFANGPVTGPETIASVVSFLAKPESYFINGQAISADGGLHFD